MPVLKIEGDFKRYNSRETPSCHILVKQQIFQNPYTHFSVVVLNFDLCKITKLKLPAPK